MTTSSDRLTQEILGDCVVHRDATVIGKAPLHVITPPRQWAYAATYPFRTDDTAGRFHDSGGRVLVDLSVVRGCVGVGLTTAAGDAFLVEKLVSGARRRTRPVSVLADETNAASQARHEDFQFEWRNDLQTVRDGHPLRCVLVASDEALENPRRVPVLD